MKNLIVVLLFLVSSVSAVVQNLVDCDGDKPWPPARLDSFSFETIHTGKAVLFFDTAFSNNIWQVGSVQKAGFPNAFSGTNALQTDTLNTYPVNNESAAVLFFDSTTFIASRFSIQFWHYYNTDTVADSCVLEFTVDSGKTWSNISSYYGLFNFYYSGSLNNYQNYPYSTDTLFWTGNSNGWLKESFCVFIYAMKGMVLPRDFGIRFRFHSDSVETNKAGWMIDNIMIKNPALLGLSVNEKHPQTISLYPNPSNTGFFTIDYPSTYVTGTIELYNELGQRVWVHPLQKSIDLSALPKGLYHYRIRFRETDQHFSGSVLLE